MQARFTLYYWPIPFRGQFARYLLTYAGEDWAEADAEDVASLYRADPADQPFPMMAPPFLHDREGDVWLSQMPAIANYLGDILGLMPGTPAQDALTLKVLGDCNDVLEAMTCNSGAAMWTDDTWETFTEDRLPEWLNLFEELGQRHGLTPDAGTFLGTAQPGVADLACAALWGTILDKLPALRPLLNAQAPAVMALSRRLADTPPLARLRAGQAARWGDLWCAGQIEASLRDVLTHWHDKNP
ncbi:MAG: glutathione S-transferase [Paracoccaceae bacterium]|nr:glutathione S-transferase [Paracoccaceae bacterium]